MEKHEPFNFIFLIIISIFEFKSNFKLKQKFKIFKNMLKLSSKPRFCCPRHLNNHSINIKSRSKQK